MTLSHHRDATRDIVFGIGITLALFTCASILPIFSLAGVVLLPLPVLVYRLKLGRKKGAVIPAVAFVIMAVVAGSGTLDLFLFLSLMLLGFVLGESYERNLSVEKTMMVACGTMTLAALFVLLFYSHLAGVGIPKLIGDYVTKSLALYQDALKKMGATEQTRQAISASVDFVKATILRVFPGLTISGILFTTWITLLLSRSVLQRLGAPYPTFGRLARWRAPEILVWTVIGCGLMLLLPSDALKLIGLNGLMILLQVYFFQGIAIVSFYFEKKRVPVAVRWCLYTLMVLQGFILVIVTGLGLFDTWLNIRKIGSDNTAGPAPD